MRDRELTRRQRATLVGLALACLFILAVLVVVAGGERTADRAATEPSPVTTAPQSTSSTVRRLSTTTTSPLATTSTTLAAASTTTSTVAVTTTTVPAPTLRGLVVDEAGTPLPGVGVYTYDEYGLAKQTTQTDGSGRYEIACPAGPVVVSASPIFTYSGAGGFGDLSQNFAFAFVDGAVEVAAARAPSCDAEAQTMLHPGGIITGRVYNPDGTTATDGDPVVAFGVMARALYPDNRVVINLIVSGGSYRVVGLPAGEYVITSCCAPDGNMTTIRIDAGATVNRDFYFGNPNGDPPAPAGEFSGT